MPMMMGKYEGPHSTANHENRTTSDSQHFGAMSTELCQVLLGSKTGARLTSRQRRRAEKRKPKTIAVPGFIRFK
tara:strand:- start:550 stop:771 length:222 start_codon:yes stop_codon:yes gene_type:complete